MKRALLITSICGLGLLPPSCVPAPPDREAGGTPTLEAQAPVAESPEPATSPIAIDDAGFVPSGWMGNGAAAGHLSVDAANREASRTGPTSVKISYAPGPAGWAALAWQYPESNWGELPGRNWQSRGYREVSFWARAARDRRGDLPSVQFKAGGHTDPAKPHPASFAVAGEFVPLTDEWSRHTLRIGGEDLSNIASALVVVIRAEDVGPDGATLWLDDIEYR